MQYPRLFFTYLVLLSMLGFLATDMYLPAFNFMQASLHTSAAMISASLSLFLAGFCCAQLFWGPLSDRIGRRAVLIAGLTLFTLSCFAVIWVNDAKFLLALRFLQALGVCAAAVCWQSLVIEHYPRAKADRTFAAIMPLVALSPALAPLLGAWLIAHFNWRAIFIVLTLVSALLIVLTYRLLPRAVKLSSEPSPSLSVTILVSHRVYTGNIIIYAACSASFFAWLTGSPFILADLGYGATAIGLSYIPQTVTFLIGGFGCRALMTRFKGQQLLPWLLTIYTLSILSLMGVSFIATPNITGLLLPFSLMAMANGAIYPIVVSNALKVFPNHSGKAAAFQNFIQLGLCFLFSLWVSSQISHALATTAIAMGATVVIALFGFSLQYLASKQSK